MTFLYMLGDVARNLSGKHTHSGRVFEQRHFKLILINFICDTIYNSTSRSPNLGQRLGQRLVFVGFSSNEKCIMCIGTPEPDD